MRKEKITAVLAAIVMLLSLTACKDNGESSSGATGSTASAGSETASGGTQSEASASVLTADIAPDTVVARTTVGGESMDITFDSFLKEYKYYLVGYGITDDTLPQYSQQLSQQREYIVNYLINEAIYAAKLTELGLDFTDEELAQIRSDYEAGVVSMKESMKQGVQATLGEGEELSQQELDARAEEAFSELMTQCGLTEDDLYGWQLSIATREKLSEYVNENFTLDYHEAEHQVEAAIEDAKQQYKVTPATFNTETYASIWLPEGSRYVQQILLKLDDETIAKLDSLRGEGKDEEADALRQEKLTELGVTLAEVQSRLEQGEDFHALAVQYTGDGSPDYKYLVTPGTSQYADGFAECAMEIEAVGKTGTCYTDYGWHIIMYTEEAVVTEEMLKETTDGVYRYMIEAYKNSALSNAGKEWREHFAYEIDREILMLAEEE